MLTSPTAGRLIPNTPPIGKSALRMKQISALPSFTFSLSCGAIFRGRLARQEFQRSLNICGAAVLVFLFSTCRILGAYQHKRDTKTLSPIGEAPARRLGLEERLIPPPVQVDLNIHIVSHGVARALRQNCLGNTTP